MLQSTSGSFYTLYYYYLRSSLTSLNLFKVWTWSHLVTGTSLDFWHIDLMYAGNRQVCQKHQPVLQSTSWCFDICLLPQASSRLLPTCPKLSSTIPMLVSKNSTTFLVITSTTSLHCSSLSDIQTATDLISDPDGFSSRSTGVKTEILVSKNETESKNSRSRLDA